MIQLSKNYSLPERSEELIPIKVVSVGGAGANALDRIVLDGLERAEIVAINTDVQSLTSSVAAHKVQLGRSMTRGLGAGGDPELGYQAAVESSDEIREALADARVIFICAGLGGGTGSGAAPYVAQLAHDAGSLVVAFATLPFTFEGKRRGAQAREALDRLEQIANAVICFENDRMGDIVAPHAGIHQAFAVADVTISQSVRAIVNLIHRPGLIRIGFDDLLAALRSPNSRCLFGFGESDSDNRAHDALTQALKNPLMDRGRMLADTTHALVQVTGGSGMTLSEVEILMHELDRHVSDNTQILFGAAVDGRMGNRLSVTIISSVSANVDASATLTPSPSFSAPDKTKFAAENATPTAPLPPVWQQLEPEPIVDQEAPAVPSAGLIAPEQASPADEVQPPPESETRKAEPHPSPLKKKPAPTPIKEGKPAVEKVPAKQEVLQFEPVTRGRFEKSEPTIVEGEDLDVPTYLRKNIRVK